MTLDPCDSLRVLALLSLALGGCLPGSLSLGDEEGSDSNSGTDTDTDTDTDSQTDTNANPPLAEGEVRWSTIRPDFTGRDLALAPDGSFYVLGWRGYHPQGDGGYYDDLWLAKYDADGGLLWEILAPQDPEASEYPVAVAVDAAGDVYYATTNYNVTPDGADIVRKLDPDGNALWTVMLPGQVEDIAAVPGGGAIVVGSNDLPAWVQQLDVDGNLGWSRTFEHPAMGYSSIAAVALTPDGGVALGGKLGLEQGSSRSLAWAATLELADGSDRWQTSVTEGMVSDRVFDVGVAADGTTLLTGFSDEPWVTGVAADGVAEWTLPSDAFESITSLAVLSDGGFALGDGLYLDMEDPNACHDGFGPCPAVMRVARFAPDRTPVWRHETSDCNAATRVAPTADGGLLTVAACNPNSSSPGLGLFRYEP